MAEFRIGFLRLRIPLQSPQMPCARLTIRFYGI
jgi:hypothetical protein